MEKRNPLKIYENENSSIAKESKVHVKVKVSKEACPNDLAPTASTTVMLALGDSIAVSLLKAKGFSSKDFARSHPGGKLGKKLTLKVTDLMIPIKSAAVVSDKSFITHNYYVNLNYFNNNLACGFILTNGSEYDSY